MKLSTTGIVQSVNIWEWGDVTFLHPTIDKDISEFGIGKIRKSSELGQLIQDGKVILKDYQDNIVTAARLLELDADGLNEDGEIEGSFILKNKIAITLNGNVNNWNPTGIENAAIIRIALSNNDRNISGIVQQTDGKILWLHNSDGNKKIVLQNNSSLSIANNRFKFKANIDIKPLETIAVFYDEIDLRWKTLYNI